MKGIIFLGKERVEYESVPDPEILMPDDVIMKINLAGICGSDLHPYQEREKGLDVGTVMGHEAIGEIVETGKEVKILRKGHKVFGPFTTSCAKCFYCQSGLTCRCLQGSLFGWVENGKGLQGLQAEYARIPMADTTLKVIPDYIDPEEALLLGDVFATGFFSAEMAGIVPSGVYAVIGAGPVGLMALIGALELGAQKIFVIDRLAERLDLAKSFGGIPINYQNEEVIQQIKNATQGRGVDGVMEAVGSSEAQRLAFDLVRPGGNISTVGVHTKPQFAFSPSEAYDKNITYRTGRCPARYYMDRLLPVMKKKKYSITSVISHRLKLSEGKRGYEIFDKKLENCTKVVLAP